jgi:hypothetical protein
VTPPPVCDALLGILCPTFDPPGPEKTKKPPGNDTNNN